MPSSHAPTSLTSPRHARLGGCEPYLFVTINNAIFQGNEAFWRGAGASASHSTQRLQLRPVMDVARPLKIPGDENHWDWKWAEAIFTKGPVAACYTHGDTSGKWRHRYRAVLELLAQRNEAPNPCNVAIISDCGRGIEGGLIRYKHLWALVLENQRRNLSRALLESKILLLVSHTCGACDSNQQSQIDCCWYGRRERIEDLTVVVDGWCFFSFLFFLLCFQLCIVLYKRNYFSYSYSVRESLRRRKTQLEFIKLFFLHTSFSGTQLIS